MIIETEELKIIPLNSKQLLCYTEGNQLEKELRIHEKDRFMSETVKMKILSKILKNINEDEENFYFYTFWIIILKKENEIAGEFCFKGKPTNGRVEIGYATFPKFHNRGIKSKSIEKIIEWVFINTEITNIIAETDSENLSSIQVLKKNKFKLFQSQANNFIWMRTK